jgi:hypothetical protein
MSYIEDDWRIIVHDKDGTILNGNGLRPGYTEFL